MKAQDYLALLLWQGCKITAGDFTSLKKHDLQNPEHLVSLVCLLETKTYLMHNRHWWKKAQSDYKYCKSKNYKLLYPGSVFYPEQFLHLFETPPVLLA